MPRWTPEARAKQSKRVREWAPWKESTGPVTLEGKAVSSRNRSPSDFVLLCGVFIRCDTKRGSKLIRELLGALEHHSLGYVSDEECHRKIEQLLSRNGY